MASSQVGSSSNAQIYLEVPRARVTRMLSKIKEDAGEEEKASELLQELQVETFGSMERREKTDFILEQLRMLRLRKDWDRFGITSKKINTKWFSEKENEVRPTLLWRSLGIVDDKGTGPQAALLPPHGHLRPSRRQIPRPLQILPSRLRYPFHHRLRCSMVRRTSQRSLLHRPRSSR